QTNNGSTDNGTSGGVGFTVLNPVAFSPVPATTVNIQPQPTLAPSNNPSPDGQDLGSISSQIISTQQQISGQMQSCVSNANSMAGQINGLISQQKSLQSQLDALNNQPTPNFDTSTTQGQQQ